ncbi:MAG: hypothetical protein JWM98_2395, partial [Thermoleophilia bacterium]|nr:hypothetical protein [Thermoleophilia bacterium]
DPRARRTAWRPRRIPAGDVAALLAGVALLALSRSA